MISAEKTLQLFANAICNAYATEQALFSFFLYFYSTGIKLILEMAL